MHCILEYFLLHSIAEVFLLHSVLILEHKYKSCFQKFYAGNAYKMKISVLSKIFVLTVL